MRVYNGLININKPAGKTSLDVTHRVSWLLKQITGHKDTKIGHCGTLDPLATGVLVLCLGQATRLVPLIHEYPKRYRGQFLLGRTTDTDDITGETLQEVDLGSMPPITREDIERWLPEFRGTIQQVPPDFSAVRVNGRRAYKLARAGKPVVIQPREVEILDLHLTGFELPHFELDITCGSGTYIRSIGRDLGVRLECGATMTQLERVSVGPFSVEQAISLEDLTIDNLDAAIQSPVAAVPHFPIVRIEPSQFPGVRNGNPIPITDQVPANTDRVVLVTSIGQPIAIARVGSESGLLHPTIVFNKSATETDADAFAWRGPE